MATHSTSAPAAATRLSPTSGLTPEPSWCPRHPRSLGQEKGGETKELSENNQGMGEGMNHQEEAVRSRSPDPPPAAFPRLESPSPEARGPLLLWEGQGPPERPRLWPRGPALLPSLLLDGYLHPF